MSMNKSVIVALFLVSACASSDTFTPRSSYPPDPWVKGYSNPDDCLGGEDLAAVNFELPEYPQRAYRQGLQGWVIVRLDVSAQGQTENIRIERAVPNSLFVQNAKDAVEGWSFRPPKGGGLSNCRILLRYKLGAVSLGG